MGLPRRAVPVSKRAMRAWGSSIFSSSSIRSVPYPSIFRLSCCRKLRIWIPEAGETRNNDNAANRCACSRVRVISQLIHLGDQPQNSAYRNRDISLCGYGTIYLLRFCQCLAMLTRIHQYAGENRACFSCV